MALSHLGSGLARPFTSFRIFAGRTPSCTTSPSPPPSSERSGSREASPPPPVQSGMVGKTHCRVEEGKEEKDLACARCLRAFSWALDAVTDIGFNTEVYSASEIDRIARVAFEVARKRGGKLCSVDKANVLEASMLWRKRVTALASELPDIELSHMYVDNAAMQLVRNPKQFDTILTDNIFGDILSDEASMITGSIGMLPSASVGESDKANPLATILSAAMLLRYGLGEENAAKRIEAAVTETLNHGFRTGDIYSPGTDEMVEGIYILLEVEPGGREHCVWFIVTVELEL
ncbi:unnamed protein product [Miscanthus lutarioriparius]|uniref:3-isopropylmalate dehydrogenase n=1 Tax=Miscanthus lutarioriparius TaxID=422564 RepID=A0A811QS85_9POAL|nr:unnamed protein product [Miscanthus lutarioriparius]